MTKVCRKCEIEKEIVEFNKDARTLGGILHRCRSCVYGKESTLRRLEDTSDGFKTCTTCGVKQPLTQFFSSPSKRSGWSSLCKGCISKKSAIFYQENRTRLLQRNTEYNSANASRIQQRISSDIQLRLKRSLRTRLWMAIKADWKAGSAVSDLGCSIPEFKQQIESLFTEGMTWENWGKGPGKWNIDHIMPISIFDLTNRQHVILACHYLNLQPLWFEDNMKKLNKYEFDVPRTYREIPNSSADTQRGFI